MSDTEEIHPYERDNALNDHLYNISRKVDKILNREPVENHAAIVGMTQVTIQRRIAETQADQAKKQAADQAQRKFGVQ